MKDLLSGNSCYIDRLLSLACNSIEVKISILRIETDVPFGLSPENVVVFCQEEGNQGTKVCTLHLGNNDTEEVSQVAFPLL